MRGEIFATEHEAEEHRDRRIDVGIARRQRRAHVVQQPDVGGEAEDRTGDNEVEHRQGRAQRRRCSETLTGDERRKQHPAAADEHLPGRRHERFGQILVAAPDRTPGPGNWRDHQGHQTDCRRGQFAARIEPEHTEEADHQADPFDLRRMAPAQHRKHAGEQRHRGHRDRGQARTDFGLRQIHQAVGQQHHPDRQHREGSPLLRARRFRPTPAQHREHQGAGDRHADGAEQERRIALQREADREVGRAPQHIHRRQRERDGECRSGARSGGSDGVHKGASRRSRSG